MTNQIRTPLEVWLIVEENFDIYFLSFFKVTLLQTAQCVALCEYFDILHQKELISIRDYFYLKDTISEYCKARGKNAFHQLMWKAREAKPRKKFIQKQILKAIRT